MALHPDHCHGHYRKEYSQINSPTKLKICLSKQKLNSKLSKNRTIKKTSMIVGYLILKSLIFESLLHGRCPTKHPQTRVQSNFRDCAVQPLLCHCFVHAKWPTLAWFVCIKLETSSRGITFFCELKLWQHVSFYEVDNSGKGTGEDRQTVMRQMLCPSRCPSH